MVEVRNPRRYYSNAALVNGKLKDIDAWVVEIADDDWNKRIPNRHLELEWGHWSGKECEAIVLAEEITGVI